MHTLNRHLALTLLAVLAGCSGSTTDRRPQGAAAGADAPSVLMQFVPGTETEYPRQEAALQTSRHHYRLVRSVLVEGTLTSAGGDALNGHVRFWGAKPGGEVDPASVRFQELDVAAGKFIADIVPGDYVADLVPSVFDWPAQRQYVQIAAAKPAGFVLARGCIYAGTVSDSNGQPLQGVAVRAISSDGALSSQVAFTGADGSYRLALGSDDASLYRLEFSLPDQPFPRVSFDSLPVTATAAVLNVRFLPTTTATVTGRVIDKATKHAAPDVSVIFAASAASPVVAARRLDTGAANNGGEAVFRAKTDAAGNFSVALPQGSWSYTLTLQAPLDRPYGGKLVNSLDLGTLPAVFELGPKAAVEGQVVDDTGAPVSLAEIVLTKTISLKDAQQVQRLYSDEAGMFRTQVDAAVGVYDVTVIPLRGGLARCTRSAVDLSAFGEAFVVHPGVHHEGFVEDEDGRPLPRVSVTLVDRGGQEGSPVRVLAEGVTPTDVDGHFELFAPKDPELTGCRTATRASRK
jgi:hypothetical protein